MRQAIEALQTDFQKYFLDEGSPRFYLLVAPVGTGKAYAATQILAHFFRAKPNARVLVLAPRVLGPQWEDKLTTRSPETSIMFVDRRKLVELQSDAGAGFAPWPSSGVVVMSTDFAVRPDVVEVLVNSRWDLIVFDEAHQLGGRRRVLLRRLLDGEGQPRLLMLSCIPTSFESERWLSGVAVTYWTEKLQMPTRTVTTVKFTWSEAEQRLFSRLDAYLAKWRSARGGDIGTRLLSRAAQSSPPALERMLDRHASRNVSDLAQDSIEAGAEEGWISADAGGLPLITAEEQRDLQLLLDELDSLDSDSKLTALQGWLSDFRAREPQRRICIYSRFVETVRYLKTALRDQHPEIVAVTGEMTTGEKRLALEDFRKTHDILVTSLVALEGFEIHAGAVVFYERPWNSDSMAAALARIRCAEVEAYEVVVLHDKAGVFQGWEGES